MEKLENHNKLPQLSKYKNKKLMVAVAMFAVLIVAGGLFFFSRHKSNTVVDSSSLVQTEGLPTLKPEDIGMVVTVRPDKNALMFQINKSSDIQKIEYEIDYNKDFQGQTIPEGVLGEMNIAQDGITKTDYRTFGTCSSGTCHYDKVVSDITIKLAVTKKDGKTYQVEKVVKL